MKNNILRLYLVPAIFTLGALIFWWEFRMEEFSLWWLAIIALILVSQWSFYIRQRKEEGRNKG